MVKLKCFWKLAFIANLKWQMCLYDAKEDKYVSGDIHAKGSWEGPMVEKMINVMRKYKNSTLLDIGGNIGFYTLAAAAAGFSVNVFEPVPANAAMIQQSIQKNNFTNIRLHTSALGAHVGELGMGIDKNNQGGVRHIGTSTTMLPTFRLDGALNFETRPVYIKIDIEGGECNALEGMQNYISKSTNITGVNMEFGQSRTKCCSQWTLPGGFFDILYNKHNLCPSPHPYDGICSIRAWDLVWVPCSTLKKRHNSFYRRHVQI